MTTSRRPVMESNLAARPRPTTAVLDPAMNAAIRARVLEGVGGLELAPRRFYGAAKRGFDIVVSGLGILAALPFMAVIALLIRLDSPGPVFFRQERLGRKVRPFSMMKFRTMYTDCVEVPPELIERNESTGPLFKMKQDPRITRVGRWLRRTSLDELPQLFNILAGEMSLVGPRPPLPREMAGYESVQRLRLRVAPGLTGLWQVSGRSSLPFDEMVRLDMQYIEMRSLWLDLTIMLRTVPSVLFGHGAF